MPQHAPPGWPAAVPPPDSPGWQRAALEWLLDQCPADYRGYAGWRRHPVALAWVAARHVDAQLQAMRQAYRDCRAELHEQLSPRAMTEVLANLEAEGLRLRAAARSAAMIHEALEGKRYAPRL
ncbi:MAG TPA: hypothetical protein VFJ12_14355 [Segeticoccus sp.]|jgi:hypothetical protein|nr:hypothetical protein [Segeticoccus sp.]